MGDQRTEPQAMTAASATEATEEGAALARSANEMVAEGGPGSHLLPTVLSDVPVAILLVDLQAAEVTFANPAAMAMGGDVSLPCAVDAWSVADRKSTRLNSSHSGESRMPSSA